ncbi:MAG: hypothetical protein UIL37_04850 [Clostridia bacterium]|nr:hypothetical protein [Clostridia bacterium]
MKADVQGEIKRRDKKISDDKKLIAELEEQIIALRQLLDCAAANIALLVKDSGGVRSLSRKDVSEALGRYKLCAVRDDNGDYILEISDSKK